MKKSLKLLISSLIIALTASFPQAIHSMEEESVRELQRETQQFKTSMDPLGTILHSSNNVWSEMKTNLGKTAEAGEAFQQGIHNLKAQFEELKTQFEESQERLSIANQNIESLNEQLKAKQTELDVLRIQTRETAMQELKAEKQRLKLQKREAREEIDRWGSRIDETLENIRILQRRDLTCGELFNVLVALEDYYKNGHYLPMQSANKRPTSAKVSQAYEYTVGTLQTLNAAPTHKNGTHTCTFKDCWGDYDGYHQSIAARSRNLLPIIKEEVAQSIELYKTLQGSTRPHWDEQNLG